MVDFSNLSKLAGKAKDLAGQHNDKIDQAIDKGVLAADRATKGKYGDQLSQNAEKLKGAVDKVADKPTAPGTPSGTGPGAATPAGDVTPAPAPAPNTTGDAVPDPNAPKDAS